MADPSTSNSKELFKQLDTLKDIQTHHVPELIKQIKTYESARAELSAAEERVNEAWEKVATAVGLDNDWGKALKEISHRNNEILGIEKEWETILEASFVQMINKGLSQETKNTVAKEKEVRKAVTKLDQNTKSTSKSTMKRKKKDAKAAMDEYNQVLQEAERKKELIGADVNYQCEMTYFMILQSISKALKQKMEGYERIYIKSKEFNEYLGTCIKIQPDFANAPKPAVMKDIYKDKKGKKDKGSTKQRSQTMSAGSLPSEASAGNVADAGGAKKGPTHYSRVAEEQKKIGSPPTPVAAPTTKHASMYLDASSPRPSDGLDLPPPPIGHAAQPKAKAKWPFAPQKEGDLPMKAGDILNILNSVGPWWMAEHNGVVGRIPANYVELLSEPPTLKLPPSFNPLGGPISPRGGRGGSPRSGGTSPTTSPTIPPVSLPPMDLPPPIDLSPRGESLPLPDSLPPPPISPKTSPRDNFPPPPIVDTLPPPIIDHLPPPVVDTLPPPVLDDDFAPPPPIRDPEPQPLPLPSRDEPPPPTAHPPVEWQQFTTEQGYVYYFNPATGESKWTLD